MVVGEKNMFYKVVVLGVGGKNMFYKMMVVVDEVGEENKL